jgi:hypothetical protein
MLFLWIGILHIYKYVRLSCVSVYEMKDPKLNELTVRHAITHEHYARACKVLLQIAQDEVQTKKKATSKKMKRGAVYEGASAVAQAEANVPLNEARLTRTLRKLRWEHCALAMERTYPVRYPPSYTPF